VNLLKRQEGKRLEFKRDFSLPEGARRAIVAFASSAGRLLLVGAEEQVRPPRGVGDPLAVEELAASLSSDGVAPRIVLEIEILPFGLTIEDLPHGVSKVRNRVFGRWLLREIGSGPQDPRGRDFLAEGELG